MILRFGLFILKPYCLILHFPKNLLDVDLALGTYDNLVFLFALK